MKHCLIRMLLLMLLLAFVCSMMPAAAQSSYEMPGLGSTPDTTTAEASLATDPVIGTHPVRRAQLAAILARIMAGSDEAVPSGPAVPSFLDVPASHWAYRYVEFMRANNIMLGFSDHTLRPDELVTRGQLAVIVARAFEQDDARIPAVSTSPTFADVPAGSPYFRFVEYVDARNAMSALADGLFHPEKVVTLQEAESTFQQAFAPDDEVSDQMIGSDRRMAVVYECWYALRRSWIHPPNADGPYGGRMILGNVAGDWNYLGNDPNARNVIRSIYGSNASRCNFCCCSSYGVRGGYGRGGQCVSFSALILYRSLSYKLYWSWSSIRPCSYYSARYAQPGDLIFRKTGVWHVAVVVKNLGWGLDVVDSNWVGYGSYPVRSGYKDSEIIGRHPFTWSQLDSGCWKSYSGRGRWY